MSLTVFLSVSSLEFYGFLSVVSPTSDFSYILEPVRDSVFLPTSSQVEGNCCLLPIQAWSAWKLSFLLPHPKTSGLFPQTESLSASCWASCHPRELSVEVWVKVEIAWRSLLSLPPRNPMPSCQTTLRLYSSDPHCCSYNWWLLL